MVTRGYTIAIAKAWANTSNTANRANRAQTGRAAGHSHASRVRVRSHAAHAAMHKARAQPPANARA
eukprot:4937423-Prymnesium_polylepis.1